MPVAGLEGSFEGVRKAMRAFELWAFWGVFF